LVTDEVNEGRVNALSIGIRAARALGPGTTRRVLASFSRGFDLVTDGGAVVILAWDGAERGPMTVLLEPCATGDPPGG
jgi:hypothetical protein